MDIKITEGPNFIEGVIDDNNPGSLYFSYIFVEPTSRSQGIGTRLITQFEEKAKELGLLTIKGRFIPETPESVDDTLDFYGKNGYRLTIDPATSSRWIVKTLT